MATLISSLNLDRIVDVSLDGDTIIDLPAGIEVVRIISAANSPRIAAIIGGSAKRLILVMNCSSLLVPFINYNPPIAPVAIWRPNTKTIAIGEGAWVWFDGVANFWRCLD